MDTMDMDTMDHRHDGHDHDGHESRWTTDHGHKHCYYSSYHGHNIYTAIVSSHHHDHDHDHDNHDEATSLPTSLSDS